MFMKITLNKGGSAEKVVDIKDIQIPDLWHTYLAMRQVDTFDTNQIKETWHLAHDLLLALREME